MGLTDALTVTALGMAVVFSGLFLTASLILSFSLVPRILAGRGTETNQADTTPQTEKPKTPNVPPHIVAAIATVLEVERRLYHSDPGGRLTISRHREARL